jgi:hypothetical protein
MNCTLCGREGQPDAKFCSGCGERMPNTSAGRTWERPALEPLVGVDEVAAFVGYSKQSVRRMAQTGLLPAISFPVGNGGSRWKFRMSAVQAHIERMEREQKKANQSSARGIKRAAPDALADRTQRRNVSLPDVERKSKGPIGGPSLQ